MRRIHFTKEGRRFLIAVVLIGFASLNTGNNLVYLLFSMMLSLTFLSYIAAFINLKGLDCTVDFMEPVYAHAPFRVDVTIQNRKLIPSYSVSVECPVSLSRKIYSSHIKRGRNRWKFNNVVIGKRGKYFLKEFRLRTGFPFIFMLLDKAMRHDKELIVYPAIMDVSDLLKDIELQSFDRETTKKGQEGDFLFSREYVYGEESRNIDWKSTAKTSKTMVREFSRRDDRYVTVILDNGAKTEEETFEKAVSAAASLCAEFIEKDHYVRLITCKKIVPFAHGIVHLFKMLDILATIQEVRTQECPVGETIEGLSILVAGSDESSFSRVAGTCSGVIDARNL
jgi:uncharacterized protein (DUF58 family)